MGILASATEIAAALALIPILATLGVDAGDELKGALGDVSPAFWLTAFAVLAVARTALNWLTALQEERGTQVLIVSLQSKLYRAVAGAHWDAVRRISPPKLTSALQTQAYDAGFGFSSLVGLVSSTVLIIGYLISSAAVFPLILPVLIVILVFMWRLNARNSAQVLARAEDYHESQTDLHQRYEDWVSISRIAALGVDAVKLSDRFENDARSAAEHAVGFTRSYAATRASYEVAVVVAVLIGVPIAWSLETPPALLAFGLVLLVRVLPQAAVIHNSYLGLVNAIAPMRNIDRLVEQLEADPARHADNTEELCWKQLSLSNVGIADQLRDEGDNWILKSISLDLAHGEWLALTGPTGAGKTTLADVMLTLLRPDDGELRIDDQPVTEETASRWRAQAAYVPQDVVLFDASIRDNLRLYAPDASDDELETALRQAAADFVIDRLPEGLDTKAGPGGRWLSGGERQRIGIARALLKKPGFLVLDEPTAALDSGTQAKLMDALGKLEHTMSVVIITHRPELLGLVDKVIEIEDGRVK